MTWAEKIAEATKRLGRQLTLKELLVLSREYTMTPEEIEEQKASWVRAMAPTGDPRFD